MKHHGGSFLEVEEALLSPQRHRWLSYSEYQCHKHLDRCLCLRELLSQLLSVLFELTYNHIQTAILLCGSINDKLV